MTHRVKRRALVESSQQLLCRSPQEFWIDLRRDTRGTLTESSQRLLKRPARELWSDLRRNTPAITQKQCQRFILLERNVAMLQDALDRGRKRMREMTQWGWGVRTKAEFRAMLERSRTEHDSMEAEFTALLICGVKVEPTDSCIVWAAWIGTDRLLYVASQQTRERYLLAEKSKEARPRRCEHSGA
jgi:hypothetical protein